MTDIFDVIRIEQPVRREMKDALIYVKRSVVRNITAVPNTVHDNIGIKRYSAVSPSSNLKTIK